MNRPRRTLLLTALIFAAPILIAVTLYQFPGIVGFTGTKNHGSLIQPARPLETIRLLENGEMLDITALEGRWTSTRHARSGMHWARTWNEPNAC